MQKIEVLAQKVDRKKNEETANSNAIPVSSEASISSITTLASIRPTLVRNSAVNRRRKL